MNDKNLVIPKKKNSLIELYRFLFAMNVVIGHGLFPIDTQYFGPDRISVEFFFILSGFLFFGSLEKLKDLPLIEAIKKMIVSKMKPLLVPVIIGLISNVILNYITNYNPLKVFRYLWYIPAMMAAFLLYTILRVLIKNDKIFIFTVAGIFIVTTLLRFLGSETLFFFDYIRSPLAVGLGILIARIPKIEIKHKWLWWAMLVPIVAATFIIVFLRLAKDQRLFEAILDLVLYPILIYVTFNIDFHFGIFDYFGGLSFGIYAYQCPARLVANLGVSNRWIPFILIFVLTLFDDIIKRVHRSLKNKKA